MAKQISRVLTSTIDMKMGVPKSIQLWGHGVPIFTWHRGSIFLASYPRSSTADSFSVRPRKAPAILLFLYAQYARPSRHVAYRYVVYRDHRHSSSSTDITDIGCHALVDLVDLGLLHRRAGLVSTPVCFGAKKKLQAGYLWWPKGNLLYIIFTQLKVIVDPTLCHYFPLYN